MSPSRVRVGTRGAHVIVEFHGCDPERLDHAKTIRRALRRAAEAAGATVLEVHVRPYSPHGMAGTALLAESHLSVHTWPEAGYAAADLYTCGLAEPRRAHDVMRRELRATRAEVLEMARGLPGGTRSLSVISLEEHAYGGSPTVTIRIDVRDGARHGVKVTRRAPGEEPLLVSTRAFVAGERVFPLEWMPYPADAEFLLESEVGEIPLGLEWDWLDVSPKWLEGLPRPVGLKLCALYEAEPGDWRATYERMTSAGERTRLLATFGEVARHSLEPNAAPRLDELTLEAGNLLSLPFVATRPIAAGEEIAWDHATFDPTRLTTS